MLRQVSAHRGQHLSTVYQNFNWYQSRHPVLYLGEILGKILSGYEQVRNTEKLFGLEEVHICLNGP